MRSSAAQGRNGFHCATLIQVRFTNKKIHFDRYGTKWIRYTTCKMNFLFQYGRKLRYLSQITVAAVPAYSPKLWVDSHRTIHNTLSADPHTSGISGHRLAEEKYVLILFPVH